MKRRKTYINTDNKNNPFLIMQQKAIENSGLTVHHNFYSILRTEYYLFNFYENIKTKKEFWKKIIKLYLLHIFRKKILWVVHNKKPHFNIKKNADLDKLSLILMKKLFDFSFKTIIMCDETRSVLNSFRIYKNENKIVKIPHPNYIDFYNIKYSPKTETSRLNFLFIGFVKKYKNIDLLIDCFNKVTDKNIFLTIAGKCTDKNYEEELKSRITNQNIICDFRYIPDNEIPPLIQAHDIVVCPNSLENSLNSGVVFLSFSSGRTVLSSYVGSLKEYPSGDFFYKYEYSSAEEHQKKLSSCIEKIIEDWKANNNVLNAKGKKAFELVKENNSLELIKKLFANKVFNENL